MTEVGGIRGRAVKLETRDFMHHPELLNLVNQNVCFMYGYSLREDHDERLYDFLRSVVGVPHLVDGVRALCCHNNHKCSHALQHVPVNFSWGPKLACNENQRVVASLTIQEGSTTADRAIFAHDLELMAYTRDGPNGWAINDAHTSLLRERVADIFPHNAHIASVRKGAAFYLVSTFQRRCAADHASVMPCVRRFRWTSDPATGVTVYDRLGDLRVKKPGVYSLREVFHLDSRKPIKNGGQGGAFANEEKKYDMSGFAFGIPYGTMVAFIHNYRCCPYETLVACVKHVCTLVNLLKQQPYELDPLEKSITITIGDVDVSNFGDTVDGTFVLSLDNCLMELVKVTWQRMFHAIFNVSLAELSETRCYVKDVPKLNTSKQLTLTVPESVYANTEKRARSFFEYALTIVTQSVERDLLPAVTRGGKALGKVKKV
jgi:hypothetical protein